MAGKTALPRWFFFFFECTPKGMTILSKLILRGWVGELLKM